MISDTGSTLVGIGAITSPLMIFALGALQLFTSRRAERGRVEVAEKVAEAAREVKTVATVAATTAQQAQEQSGKILELADKTHTLVNSQYGIALALIVEKAARIYEISKTAADLAELEKAKLKLADHEAKQHVVDAKDSQLSNKKES
jgi:hypothetical protein